MFSVPIRHTPLRDMEELFDFSLRTECTFPAKTFWSSNGQIAFSDESKYVWVTPYRIEIQDLLAENGYKEAYMPIPYSNGEEFPEAYKWLSKIADEENWAYTYGQAYSISSQKGIQSVELEQKVQIKEIDFHYDNESEIGYSSLVSPFFANDSHKNIGTYILIDSKTVVVCDEYGRTFLLKAKSTINDTVNQLLEAGYKRTIHPEHYVTVRNRP